MNGKIKASARIGGLNFLAAIAAHIPCCGSQLFLGIFGLQALGAVSTTLIYRFQFAIPVIISLFLTIILIVLSRYKSNSLFCPVQKSRAEWKRNAFEFFAANLVIGYTIVFILYLFIPPHDHRIIDTRLEGRLSSDGSVVSVAYVDSKRLWPWSQRYYLAKLPAPGEAPQPAKEVYWYQIFSGFNKEFLSNTGSRVSVHLYARPSVLWLNIPTGSAAANKKPLDFYVSLNDTDKFLAPDTLLNALNETPSLVLFYSRNCTPCQIEMRLLPNMTEAAPDLHITVVTLTSTGADMKAQFEKIGVQLIDASSIDGAAILRRFNDAKVALPFSLAVDKNREVCARRAGLMGLEIIKDWRQKCLM